MNVYLSLDAGLGKFFEYSKEAKEGFEKVETTKDNVTKVSYRKYYNEGVFGYLRAVHTREKEMGKDGMKVTHVRIIVQDDKSDNYVMEFTLKNQKGGLTDYSVSTLCHLPFLKEGVCYRVFPYAIENTDQKGKVRKNYGVSFALARLSDKAVDTVNKIGKLTITRKDKDGKEVKGDLPAVEWTEGLDDKMVMNSQKRDVALWNKLKEHKFGETYTLGSGKAKTFDSKAEGIDAQPVEGETPRAAKPVAQKAPEATTTQAAPTVATSVQTMELEDDDDDDMPF
jgi:hypothetical protein